MPAAGAAAPVKASPSIIAFLVWMVLGGAMGVLLVRAGIRFGLGGVVMVALGGFAASWLQMLVHEAGHALAGIARGMHLLAIGLGPLRVERTQAGWHTRWARNVAGIGGFAVLIPTPGRALRRIDQAIFTLGGPLANLLVAASLLPVAMAASKAGSSGAAVAWVFVIFGTFIGIVNLVPFRSGGWRTDGLTLLQLWRRPEEARAGQQVLSLVGLSLAGVRPRDWDESLIPAPDPGFDPMLGRSIDLMRLSHAIDADRCEAAKRIALSIAIDHPSAPDGIRQNQALMMATFAARCAGSESLLAAWLPLTEGSMFALGAQREWLRAELALLRGDPSAAKGHAAASRAALPRVHDAASLAQMQEYLDEVEHRIGSGAERAAGAA